MYRRTPTPTCFSSRIFAKDSSTDFPSRASPPRSRSCCCRVLCHKQRYTQPDRYHPYQVTPPLPNFRPVGSKVGRTVLATPFRLGTSRSQQHTPQDKVTFRHQSPQLIHGYGSKRTTAEMPGLAATLLGYQWLIGWPWNYHRTTRRPECAVPSLVFLDGLPCYDYHVGPIRGYRTGRPLSSRPPSHRRGFNPYFIRDRTVCSGGVMARLGLAPPLPSREQADTF